MHNSYECPAEAGRWLPGGGGSDLSLPSQLPEPGAGSLGIQKSPLPAQRCHIAMADPTQRLFIALTLTRGILKDAKGSGKEEVAVAM